MYNNENVLNDIVKATQMGIGGITAVLDAAKQPALRMALKQQRREYTQIQQQARALAAKLGHPVSALPPVTVGMSAAMARGQLLLGRKDEKIAGMMIQGNTRGVIQSLKNMRRCNQPAPEVAALAQKMLDTERSNIIQMEGFL